VEEGLAPVGRKVIVCVRRGCTKCEGLTFDAPADCPYLILHALELPPKGVQWMPRQSGKTTLLVQQANEVVEKSKEPVYFIAFNKQEAVRVQRQCGLDSRIRVFTKYAAKSNQMRGIAPGWLFMDEVDPNELARTGICQTHRLVSAFYT